MNFKELQDEVSELINFNSLQTDQDFTTAQIKNAVNRAYAREYRKARQEGIRRYFSTTTDVVWESGSVTLELPERIRGSQICRVSDVTSTDPGTMVVFDDRGFLGDVFWKDRVTLQWGQTGPNETKTLRFEIMPEPSKMLTDDEVPDLVSPDHHELIFYSAAIDLKTRADEMAPPSWMSEREELRMDYYKDVSRGRPHSDVTSIRSAYPDSADFIY
tara:strand:+ start:303 stop:950 length:648 start_codon:yes stop_codon:yes gene_type:complete